MKSPDGSPTLEAHPLRRVAGALGLVAVLGAGLQVPHQLARYNENSHPGAEVTFYDPLTWLSAPVATGIEKIEKSEHHQN